jgi:YHS domain-containing protein
MKQRTQIFKITIVYISIWIIAMQASAQVDPVDKNGLALGGFDPVSYFKLDKPVRGNPEISLQINQATYWFFSEESRAIFQSNPGKYLPQFDGYCALAVGTTGKKISVDPETYKITDGKLYLFFNGKSFSGTKFNSIDPWIKDETNLIRKSNEMWPKVKMKKYTYEK